MAEHPDREPEPTTPRPTEPSTSDDDNPPGLLFISDVQALRRADTVSFTAADGAGLIDATLTTLAGDEPRIYTATQQRLFPDPVGADRRRRIAVAADIAGYDPGRRWHDHQLPGATATASIGGAPFHDVWRSIAAFLRVGDIVRLRWQADTSTDQLTAYGLHRDDLHIEVRRGARVWTFLLQVSVRPPDDRTVTAARP
ncbi:hypothetical protein [Dactylosporangium sp. CA-139066]|uniref:hypothetical protein n=1 Tax=Dactylosporangium sp. CA-139066 TaxID=3239930 RepID=UPI003D926D23